MSVERFQCLCSKFLLSGIVMYVSDTNLANNLGVQGKCQKVDRKCRQGVPFHIAGPQISRSPHIQVYHINTMTLLRRPN